MVQTRNQGRNQKIHAEKWRWKHKGPISLGCSKNSSKREIYSNIGLPQEARKCQINNLTLCLRKLEKEKQAKPEASRRKEIIKIIAEINDTET